MRLFVAINLPAPERRKLHEECNVLRERDLPVRWVEPDNYHVTLKFLGDVPTDAVDGVSDVVARVAEENEPFELKLAGFGAFPTIRRPRVLWLGVEASPALRCLKQDLEWALADRGFERETQAFHPHVTLGRASDRGGAGAFRGLDEVTAGISYSSEVALRALDVMRSSLTPDGPRYTVVSSNRLGAAG